MSNPLSFRAWAKTNLLPGPLSPQKGTNRFRQFLIAVAAPFRAARVAVATATAKVIPPVPAASVEPPRPRMTLDAWCAPLGVNLATLNGKSPEQSRAIIREQIARMAADQAEAIGFPFSFERALAAIPGATPGAAPQSRLGMIASMLGAAEAELATMSVDDAPKFIAHRMSDLAMSQISSIGVPANRLPKVTGEIGGGDTLEEIRAQAAEEKDPAKLGILAAKAIAIRDRKWAAQ